MKKVTTHLGVRIYKQSIEIPGSSLRETKTGELVDCKPQFTHSYVFGNSYPYDSKEEAVAAINRIRKECGPNGSDPTEFAMILNEGEPI